MNKFNSLSLIVFFVLTLIFACSSTESKNVGDDERKSDSYYQLGLAALNKGDYIKAKREFTKAIEISPNLPHYYNLLGLVYLIEHNYKKAEENCKRALKIDEKFSDARNNLGSAYLYEGEYGKALTEFNAILADPTYLSPHHAETNIGIVYMKQKQYDLAEQHFKAALKMKGTHCEAYKQLGIMYDEQGLQNKAIENYKKTLEYCSYNFEVLYIMAQKMYVLKQEDRGREYLLRCLEADAKNVEERPVPFLKECVDFAAKVGVTDEIQLPEKPKQQIDSPN